MSERRALIAIAGGAVALRLLGLQFGLPAVYNPDEVAIMARALSFANGTLNPHNFLYPTFYFYVLFAWVGAWLGVLLVTGRVASLAALKNLYFLDPTPIYAAGRTLGVAAGTATVVLLFRLAAKLTDRRTALAASVFLAVAPLHVRDSHYVKHDVPATLAVVAAYLAIVRVWSDRRGGGALPVSGNRDLLIAAAATGVAFSTHYYCIFLAVPLAYAIARSRWTLGLPGVARGLLVAAAVSAAVFLALSPFIAAEPLTALRDITANRQIVVDRAVSSGPFAPALRYAEMLWRDTAGAPVILLAVVGVIAMLRSAPALAWLLLAFPVPFLLFISNTAPASRYLNPVVPFIAIFAATGLEFAGRAVWRRRAGAFWIAVALCAAPGLLSSIRTGLFFRQADTRTIARQFIEEHVPAGSGILVQPYSVPLVMSRAALQEALAAHLGSLDAASPKFKLQLGLDPYPTPAYRLIYLGSGGLDVDRLYVDPRQLSAADGLDQLRRVGVAFVVLKRYNDADQDSLRLLTALAREGRRIAAFSPYRPGVTEEEQARIEPFLHNTDSRMDSALERPGPPLEIWQIDGPGLRQP